MTKREFLDSLRAALSTRVGASVVNENINYYEDYINTQMRMGRSEAEVLEELGDPRLLARSIAEANKRAGTGQAQETVYRSTEQDGYSSTENSKRTKTFRTPIWLILIFVVCIIALILSVVFSVLSILAPILLPVLLVVVVLRLLGSVRRW